MTTPTPTATASPRLLAADTANAGVASIAFWLTMTVVFAAMAYYFVGYDQGAVSVFGQDTHVHEFVHDSRHFLGFPCH